MRRCRVFFTYPTVSIMHDTTRRNFLTTTLAVTGAAATTHLLNPPTMFAQLPPAAATPDFRIQHGAIRQSVMGWCFSPMPAAELARHARQMGMVGIEGIPREAYPAARELGLEISLVSSHGFAEGPCNPRYRDLVIEKLIDAIQVAKAIKCQRVITFTGMKFEGMDRDRAIRDCLEVWKKVLPLAEASGVTLCLEHLNSRDGSHPMKGHPGYFGDDVDFCIDLIRQIGSPSFRLLFDIYHVSIMNGDVIRRIRKYHEYIAHYHTAGNPGRGELDDTQEINYPAIMKAILETNYEGFVVQEFIPTWNDKIAALRHAAEVCDVPRKAAAADR
jgi:hydroxypyruvate isomerase